jgi:hypothetical protein
LDLIFSGFGFYNTEFRPEILEFAIDNIVHAPCMSALKSLLLFIPNVPGIFQNMQRWITLPIHLRELKELKIVSNPIPLSLENSLLRMQFFRNLPATLQTLDIDASLGM